MAKQGNRNVRRGSELEAVLAAAFDVIPGCTVRKSAPPFKVTSIQGTKKVGFFEENGMCDFEGGYFGQHVCIDAKRINGAKASRWNIKSNLKDHQYSRMRDCQSHGSIAGVILQWDTGATAGADPSPTFWMPVQYISHLSDDLDIKSVSLDDLRGPVAAAMGIAEIHSMMVAGGIRTILTKLRRRSSGESE